MRSGPLFAEELVRELEALRSPSEITETAMARVDELVRKLEREEDHAATGEIQQARAEIKRLRTGERPTIS